MPAAETPVAGMLDKAKAAAEEKASEVKDAVADKAKEVASEAKTAVEAKATEVKDAVADKAKEAASGALKAVTGGK